MYKKFLIVASKKDKAGINITTALSQFGDYDFHLVENEAVYTESLNFEKINSYDFVIFASRHSSGKGEKALTVHTEGNFRGADFGGERGKVSSASAIFNKQIFEKLNENVEKHKLMDYSVTLEATHHGPLIEKPSLFIEIGSTDLEYNDRRAAFVVAKTIHESIKNHAENPYNEVAVAIGGPHYCPNFNKIQLNSNIAISHIIPQYAMPITEEMIKEAIEKTEEEVDFVVLDWKGLGKAEQRDEVVKILEDNYIQWKKTGDIDKY